MVSREEFIIRIVDDDPFQRKGLALLLEQEGWKTLEYETGTSLLINDKLWLPGIILLDLVMPERDGLSIQKELMLQERDISIVFMSAHGDIPAVVNAMREGAFDFLEKPISIERLLQLVERLYKRAGAVKNSKEAELTWCSLTKREQKISKLYALGNSQKAIADSLAIQPKTVNNHIQSIYKKLRIHSIQELKNIVNAVAQPLE